MLETTMEILTKPKTYCRLCLNRDDLTRVFTSKWTPTKISKSMCLNSEELIDKIYQCTNIRLSSKEDARCAICRRCLKTVKQFHEFRETTNKVNDLIQRNKVTVKVDRKSTHGANNLHQCPNCLANFHHARSVRLHLKVDCLAASQSTKQRQVRIKRAGDASQNVGERKFPKPGYSFSCLIALALKNSHSGSLLVTEMYSFICEHFPYFKTAPIGWKNSLRHNLSLNKCFVKIKKPTTNGGQRKYCLWTMNPDKITKMDEEVQKWSRKDARSIRSAMEHPEQLEALERGEKKHGSTGDEDLDVEEDFESDDGSSDDDVEVVEPEEEEKEDDDILEVIGNETEMPEWFIENTLANRPTANLAKLDEDDEDDDVLDREMAEEEDDDVVDLETEEDEDDYVELVVPKLEKIEFDAIKMPELLIDSVDEEEEDHQDSFNVEVPEYYQHLRVNSKDCTLELELSEQDLLSLEDEDKLDQQQQNRQQQPPPKRARNSESDCVRGKSFQQHFEQLQQQQLRHKATKAIPSKRKHAAKRYR